MYSTLGQPYVARRAFSLVELSIVLVILGLLVGGVLSGQALIRASQLRNVTKEYEQYRAALHAFRDKYMGLPGDIANATSFWGYQNVAGCTNRTSAATNLTTGVCDGDGDGVLRYSSPGSRPGEAFQGWRQLGLAGLIPGNYSGVGGTASDALYDLYSGRGIDHTIGVNAPGSKIGNNVGWSLSYFDNSNGWNNVYTYQQNFQNWLNIGTRDDGRFTDDPFMTPSETWSIDSKIDDGKPNSGIVFSRPITGCTTSSDTVYNLANNTNACSLILKP